MAGRLTGKNFMNPIGGDYMSDYEAFQIATAESHSGGRMTQRVMDRWTKSGICPTIAGQALDRSCQGMVEARAAELNGERERKTHVTLESVRRATEAMATTRGRKSLLLFSRGFVEDPGAGLRDLTLVTQEEPTASEDPLQFLLVDLRLDKDAAADETVIVIDHPAHFCGHSDCLL